MPSTFLKLAETNHSQVFNCLQCFSAQTRHKMPLPPLFGLVMLSNVFGTQLTLTYMGSKVMAARKKYDVQYPAMYAEGDSKAAKAFNCIQRGHQNAYEMYTSFLAMSLFNGLQFPVLTSLFGICWIVGRLGYFKGYASGNPEKRKSLQSVLFYVGYFGSLITMFISCASMIKSANFSNFSLLSTGA
ncbi:MAG: hypothetical protein MHM6MM_005421 [Cercozoa sp. M6MM]